MRPALRYNNIWTGISCTNNQSRSSFRLQPRIRRYSNKVDGKHLILLSGGVESSTLLHNLAKNCSSPKEQILCAFFDYGQRGAQMEWSCSVKNAELFGLSVTKFDLSQIGETLRSRQKQKLHIPIMHRNLPILSVGVSFAAQEGATHLHLGITLDDQLKNYASASLRFAEAFQNMINTLGIELKVETLFAGLTKIQIIQLGTSLGMDYRTTYSCMLGYERHCGTCQQCKSRRQAFIDAGFPEPDGVYKNS